MPQMVFVPFSRADAVALRDSGRATEELTGYAATPSLMESHGYDPSTLEDAEFAALSYAGVHALGTAVSEPLRLVLAAAVPPGQVSMAAGDPYGVVSVDGLRWSDVQALFSDEPEAAADVATARAAGTGQPLSQALSTPAVEAVFDEHDLLWFAPEELDRLP